MLKVLLLISIIYNVDSAFDMQVTQNLTESLLSGYNKMIRPAQFVVIVIQPELIQILSIDEKNQVMSSSVVLHLLWNDTRLSWNNNTFPIETITIPAKEIWIPDLYIINSLDDTGFLKIDDFLTVSVKYDGQVLINLPWTSLQTRCNLNIKTFPFDKQACDINVTAWNLQNNQHLLWPIINAMDTYNYKKNSVWDLTKSEVGSETEKYGRWSFNGFYQKSGKNFIFGYVRIYLTRKPLYYVINGIVPALVLNIVNIISFFLPFEKQIELTITCFLTFSVNLIIVAAEIPVQSDNVPTITMYFLFSIIYTLIGLFWFTFLNYFTTRNYLPLGLSHVARFPENMINYCSNRKIQDVKQNAFTNTSEEEKKAEFERLTTRLNYYFLILFLIFMIVSLLWIWISRE